MLKLLELVTAVFPFFHFRFLHLYIPQRKIKEECGLRPNCGKVKPDVNTLTLYQFPELHSYLLCLASPLLVFLSLMTLKGNVRQLRSIVMATGPVTVPLPSLLLLLLLSLLLTL